MGPEEIPTATIERTYRWNIAWYVVVEDPQGTRLELKFRQKNEPSGAQIQDACERMTAAREEINPDQGLSIDDLKDIISDQELGPLDLFTQIEINQASKVE